MSYFETHKGQVTMEVIANSLVRIAKALEENNELVSKAITMSETSEKRVAQAAKPAKSDVLSEII